MKAGTVSSTSPLAVRRDGDAIEVPAAATDVDVAVGDRVLTQMAGRTVYILVKLGPPTSAHGHVRTATDSNGFITITHGLGVVPTTVLLSGADADPQTFLRVRESFTTATTFQVACRNSSGSPVAGGVTTSVHWMVLA